MSTTRVIHTCAGCGAERIGPGIGHVTGDRWPCANEGCGSVDLLIEVQIGDDADLHDELRGKLMDSQLSSRKGRKLEFVSGADYFKSGQRWHRVERIIDFANDRYVEAITDESIGAVLRSCHEPLSEHQGRGGAEGERDNPA